MVVEGVWKKPRHQLPATAKQPLNGNVHEWRPAIGARMPAPSRRVRLAGAFAAFVVRAVQVARFRKWRRVAAGEGKRGNAAFNQHAQS